MKEEVTQLRDRKAELFDADVLHIFNGQHMYDECHSNQLMGNSDYVAFNEAMCVHPASKPIFDDLFIQLRAGGHRSSVDHYNITVMEPLQPLFRNHYNSIVLWFGEDVFCQMNLLTILAYLEQSNYKGNVFLNSFRDEECKVNQTELVLGSYLNVYEAVLLHRQKPLLELSPVMHQAIKLHLSMQVEDNSVTRYIKNHADLCEPELVKQLISAFPTLGYGDLQYSEIIKKVRGDLCD